jgi:nitroimidazol reductase NimA-like FMN-containing flavoprotein (pyridoxamine 5'-phosphate oxidase superfamily)
MAKGFDEATMQQFLEKPRLAILLYHGKRAAPTGVPVWFHWDGTTVHLFAGRTSVKVKHLKTNPNISILVTNDVGEPEGWVAFDGSAKLDDFTESSWHNLIDQVAPRYWDLSQPAYKTEIKNWRANPEAFVSISLTPDQIRTGA